MTNNQIKKEHSKDSPSASHRPHSPAAARHKQVDQKSPAPATEPYIEGVIRISAKGLGYVKTREMKESVEIDPPFLNHSFHGDRVRVLIHPKMRDGKQTGEVTQIILRSKVGFSGILKLNKDIYYVSPADQKMYTDIMIPKENLGGAKVGQKVFTVITGWPDPTGAPFGEITKVLGKPGENNAEMEGIALEKGFSFSFSDAVEKEAAKLKSHGITDSEIKKRRDFRGVPTLTIDPEDAKDFDDALSVQKIDEHHFEIGIHIADVSHYVRPGTALDREALRRGTSVYLVDRTIPMLPEILSNDLCSLNPEEDKLTMSAVFTLDMKGHVKKEWFGKTIIHSNKRFSYESAQKILDDKQGFFYEELHTINEIAKKLREERFEKGAILLDQEEVKFILDENGVPLKVIKKIRQDTNKMIEEFMLLANRRVAESIAKGNEKVFVYRIHDIPDRQKMEALAMFLKKLGYHLPLNDGEVSPKALNELIVKLEGKAEKDTVHSAVIRSMQKAIYSTKNIGHFGLAFAYYTHFTSPIRRYPDTIVHRLLDEYLRGQSIKREEWDEYEQVSNFCSQREKEAQDAERASIKYKQVEYMMSRIGEIYDGTITGITDWGIYVEEKETKSEGLVRLRDLKDDFYTYSEKDLAIIGRKQHKKYRIGDTVKIKVKNADLNKKVIDYIFV